MLNDSPTQDKQELIPTPPLPADLGQVELTDNARQVLVRRYVRRGQDGKPAETVEEMFWRVAYHVARVEEAWGQDVMWRARQYYELLTSKAFFPNSPTFTGAGTPLGQLAACFVLPISDDMGRDPAGIFQTLRDAALIQQTGGGNGFSFSRLRPKDTLVKSSAGRATGPVGFLRVYDKAFGEVAQGGTRRGANMAVLRVDHPDIEEFITCKTDENAITNFNISVGITDAFMRAVENDEPWPLRFPDVTAPEYKGFSGTLEQAEAAGLLIKMYKTVNARELFDKIVRQAHHNGEPGMLFLDASNRSNPVPHLYQLEATNPCGEQWLGPHENCCLGSVNLAQHSGPDGTVDWEKLRRNVALSTIFLDDVVEANAYVPAVPQLKVAAHRARRIGLGIMGLGDLMYHAGIRYGSEEGQEFAAQVMEFVRYHAMLTSIELAEARGPFLAIQGSIYDPQDLRWQPPVPLEPYTRDWGRPPVDWSRITTGIRQFGIRNAAQTTVAPTGCLVPGTLVTTDHGLLPIEALGNPHGERWQDVGFHVASEGGVQPATQFYINGKAHTTRATTRRGYSLQGTDGHRIRVWKDGEWKWRRMDELEPGMLVPLQVTGLIGQPKRVCLDNSLTTDFHASPVKLPAQMSPDLAYLIGFFMGDGSLKDRSLRFSVSDTVLRDRLADLIQTVFGLRPIVSQDKRSKSLESLEIHSRNLVEFWRRNGLAKGSPNEDHSGKGYQPYIPLVILRTNDREIYAAFLAGLFDADATVHRGHLLCWSTADRLFHDQVKALLLTMGILTTSDFQTTGLGKSRAYRLRTAHAEAGLVLVDHLPYLCSKRPHNGHVRRHTLRDTIPLTAMQMDVLLASAGPEKEQWMVWAWRQRKRATRESLRTYVGAHRDELMEAGLQSVVETVEKPIFFDEIRAVEDGGWLETYDLSVPETHAYIANGFISHNTIATVAGCEGYGCEPVFALAYIRHVNDHGKDLQLTYTSPQFEQALVAAGLEEDSRRRIVEEVMELGTCQGVAGVPEEIQHAFVVSGDISAEEHVRMQAAMQAFVDNSLSKTVNFPADADEEDVATAYMLAWELGCKGITVYVTGSRQKVVLETQATAKLKQAPAPVQPMPAAALPEPKQPEQLPMWHETKKPRPRHLHGYTYHVSTPLGKAFVTINENGGSQPFEVFINTAKAGSDTAAVSEAIGRLISYILRLASPVAPRERLKEVWRQLSGIGGGRSLGFGPNRVRSLPDGVAQTLAEYLENTGPQAPAKESGTGSGDNGLYLRSESALSSGVEPHAEQPLLKFGDLCPECGQAAVVNEEGCRKCYACGFSEC